MNAPMPALNVPHTARLRVADFMLLNDAGAFADDGKVELVEGEIICMNAQYMRHASIKTALVVELVAALRRIGSALRAVVEVGVALSHDSMPEPDITLTSYRGSGPVPIETVALLVEVSDTTLDNDLGRKAALYARAGVAEYWVVDVEGNSIVRHAAPGAYGYAARQVTAFGDALHAATIDGLVVDTAMLD